MSADKPVFWHQGLFLQPQHLQFSDRYHGFQLQPFQRYGRPYFWGVVKLEVNEATLANKSFEVNDGEFIFQDGTYVVLPGNGILGPRSFDEAWVEADKRFTVYLGLRKWNRNDENVTVLETFQETGNILTRYVTKADPEEVRDIHAGGPNAQVKRLSHALRIFWENEIDQLDNYDIIPIAQFERSGEEIILSRRFVPPCPTLSSSEWLLNTMKDIRDQITSRCRQLEEYKSPKEVQTMEFDVGYMVFILALRSLNRFVPALYHILETRHVHPWECYGVLRQVIGELSTFSENLSATGERTNGEKALPAYDHLDLWNCYASARTLIGELLEGITVSPGQVIRLEYDGAYYSGRVPERIIDSRNRYWLSLRTEMEPEAVSDTVQRLVKLSARRNLTTLISRAVPGLPLEHFPVPPPGLPRRANTHYFRIDQASTLWLDVESELSISLFWDTAPGDLLAEIIVLKG